MSANVDQRSKGQPNQVSNGSNKDVMKEDDPYLQPPVHSMRSWSEQASDSPYGAPPMSNAGVSDPFFQNYYASNMTYPFMNQGISGSEGPWSNGADTMFGMGYDYSSMYGGFGFPPFNNWEYASEYWGSSQPQRKDQRGSYPPHQDDPYYHSPEMIPADTYGMMTNGVAPVPQEPQEPIGTVEHGLRGMSIGGGGGHIPSSSAMTDPSAGRKKTMDLSQQPPNMTDGFGGSGHHHQHHAEPPHLMMQHPPPMTHQTHQQPPQPSSAMMGASSANSSMGGSGGGGGHGQPKKTSWAAIASQPARTQQQLRPRTIPRAPVNPNKPHSGNMDIGTWDNRGGNMAGKLPVQALQPPPSVSPAVPPMRVQSWAASSAPPPRAARQVGPPPSSSSNSNNSPSASGISISSNVNNNSSSSGGGSNSETGNNSSGAPGPSPSAHPSSGYSNYSSGSGASSGHNGSASGGSGNNANSSSNNSGSSATMNGGGGGGGHMSSGGSSSRDSQQAGGSANATASAANPVLDQLKYNNYNPKEFNLNPKSARFFIIKSYSEDDIHRSIKYNIWCSTEHGNKRLDSAFREREGKGPVYLIYSVNGSGHFCGIAQMMSPVDYNKSAGVWAQDKWKGQFTVKWVYVKDVPNSQLRHIRLENNENKPVTNSRDTQEVPAEKGKQVLRILHAYKHFTSIFDDFVHYEKRQQEDAANASAPPSHHGQQHRGANAGGDHRGDGRGDHRDHKDRGEGMGGRNRDNRRGGGGYDMGGRGGHDHRDGGRNHDQRGGGYHDGGRGGSRH